MHRIVVEGPDGVGKTSICSALARRLNIRYYKSSREHGLFNEPDAQYNVLKWGVYEQISMIEQCGVQIVLDRFFPSEYAYSTVFSRKSDHNLVKRYDAWWNKIGGVIIFLDKPAPVGTWEDDLVPIETYQSLRDAYQTYRGMTVCRHTVIDTSGGEQDLEEQLHKIEIFLQGAA